MVRSGHRRQPWIRHRSWENYALVLDLILICQPKRSVNMLTEQERRRHTVTVIRQMGTTCGTRATPVPRPTLLDRRTRTRGDSTICMEMFGSGVLTGGVGLCRTARIPRVLPRGRAGCYAVAAGPAMRTTAPRPTDTTALRRACTTTSASA